MATQLITKPANHIHQGMPALKPNETRATSFFEFWPSQLIYLPVILQWLWLALRYRSLSLPLIANPSIPLSGMVGESKSSVLELAGKQARPYIAPFISFQNDHFQPINVRMCEALDKTCRAGINFPMIAKPDMGCRGAGVKIIHDDNDLQNYIKKFPDHSRLLLQHKIPHEAEAGIFYIRYPGQSKGEIFSVTLKYMPYVIGDGKRSLRQLIQDDARASKIYKVYFNRHKSKLNQIVPEQQAFRLAFAGSHCKGSIFRNGNNYITDDLVKTFDHITADIKGFYYGRFDVRFESIEKLMRGEAFSIIEINGASSEATHIWDCNTNISEVYKTLFHQYKTLFQIGNINRKQGHLTPAIWQLFKAWREESKLVKQYPETD